MCSDTVQLPMVAVDRAWCAWTGASPVAQVVVVGSEEMCCCVRKGPGLRARVGAAGQRETQLNKSEGGPQGREQPAGLDQDLLSEDLAL